MNRDEIKKIFNNYKVFVDTCSLLEPTGNNYFSKELPNILIKEQKKIIIIYQVIKELEKHAKNSNSGLKKKAYFALKTIKDYQKYGIAQIQGDKNGLFSDNVFITVFTKFRLEYNLALITQDIGLSKDIMNLGNKTKAVQYIKKIKVLKISNTGQLEPFEPNKKNKQTSKHKNPRVNSIDKFKIAKTPITISNKSLNRSKLPTLKDKVFSKKYGSIELLEEISSGGEGIAYLTKNNLVCKIYKKQKLNKNKFEKLKLMINKPIEKKGICWPKDLVYNNKNEFVGFLMDKADGYELQKSIFMPMLLKKKFPDWKKYHLVKLSQTVLSLISYLHERNVIIGDINPLNILVKNEDEVYFIDTDSFQIENYPCTVGTVNYTAPEIQGKDYKNFLRNFEHEKFAIATLLFMILLPGKPPYSQQGGGNPSTNIKKQDFSYPLGEKSNQKTPPGQWRYIWSNLLYKIKEAFYNTFKNGNRLSVDEWQKLINQYLYEIDQKHLSNEIFPSHFKIVDPTEVSCSKCGRVYTESSKFIKKLKSEGKSPICNKCRSNFNANSSNPVNGRQKIQQSHYSHAKPKQKINNANVGETIIETILKNIFKF